MGNDISTSSIRISDANTIWSVGSISSSWVSINSFTSYKYETINGFDIQVLVPGFTMNEIVVEHEGEKVTVKTSPNNEKYRGQEMPWKVAGTNTFTVPGCETVYANLKNGVLYLYAPKKVKGVNVDIVVDE